MLTSCIMRAAESVQGVHAAGGAKQGAAGSWHPPCQRQAGAELTGVVAAAADAAVTNACFPVVEVDGALAGSARGLVHSARVCMQALSPQEQRLDGHYAVTCGHCFPATQWLRALRSCKVDCTSFFQTWNGLSVLQIADTSVCNKPTASCCHVPLS